MPDFYHDGHRALQAQFDTTRLAGRLQDVTLKDYLESARVLRRLG